MNEELHRAAGEAARTDTVDRSSRDAGWRAVVLHCTDIPPCSCVTDLLELRDRLVGAAEEKNRRIQELERQVRSLIRTRRSLERRIVNLRSGSEEPVFKRRNGELYTFIGRALDELLAHNANATAELLIDALALSPEQLDERSFKASLRPRNGHHPNGDHLRAPSRNQAIRKRVKPAQRQRIFARDGHRCQTCGTGGDARNPLTIDHIVSIGRGGTNNDTNLQTLCATCNRRKNQLEPIVPPPLDPSRDLIRRVADPPRRDPE